MNELGPLARFIYTTTQNDSQWVSLFGNRFREELIPTDVKVTQPVGMFVEQSSRDVKTNFGMRMFTIGVYQIKGVVEGSDFSLLGDCADIIDRLFDWQNQMVDGSGNPTNNPNIGHPKSQYLFNDTKPGSSVQLMIMSMSRNSPYKSTDFADGVNYCHLGGIYEIQYYKL